MIAAIYARKSNEQLVADDQKSVTRQIAHARAFARGQGWRVDDEFVFVDDGISGAEFAARPGFVRLMAALKPRPGFQILIMTESSRLGREAWETGYALKQLLVAGVRVFFSLEHRECTFDHPFDKLQFSIVQAFDEMERARASQRSTEKAISQARAGHVTGGRVFGYDNVPVLGAGGVRSHVERRINDAEAAVVRRIFALAATGLGQAKIARQLNAEGAVSPRAQQGRPHAWATSSVHEVLFRPLYRGEFVWNQTRKRNAWGEKRGSARPEAEWIRQPAPELRIVPEELWQAAHARIDQARQAYREATKGLRGGRPRIDSKYLLPGFARCAVCNGGLCVRTGSTGTGSTRRRAYSYACTNYLNRGPHVCRNGLRVPMGCVDEAVLGALRELLNPSLVDEIVTRLRTLAAEEERPDQEADLARALAAAEEEVTRYVGDRLRRRRAGGRATPQSG